MTKSFKNDKEGKKWYEAKANNLSSSQKGGYQVDENNGLTLDDMKYGYHELFRCNIQNFKKYGLDFYSQLEGYSTFIDYS